MQVYQGLAFLAAGLAVGSFLNVVADRLPQGQSLVSPPSHCPYCKTRLKPADLVPVFSFLLLRGRCRYCQARIPLRLPIVEGACALAFFGLFWAYGLAPRLAPALIVTCFLLVTALIDLEKGIVLDEVILPGAALILALSPLWPGLGVIKALIGGATGFAVLTAIYLLARGGMGGGDVRLGAISGIASGFPFILMALGLAFISGGLVAAFFLATGRKGWKSAIPLGPFLAASAWATFLWGKPLADLYLSLF